MSSTITVRVEDKTKKEASPKQWYTFSRINGYAEFYYIKGYQRS